MLAVGVTGGIGVGKSEVCRVFGNLGASVVSADTLAKELVDEDPALKKKIRSAFGHDIYDASGRLDRKRVAKLAFSDDTLLDKLNAIVHPRVTESIRSIIERARRERNAPMVVVEAALIVEAGITGLFDYIIAVESDAAVRVARVVQRDGISEADVQARMRNQYPPESIAEEADFVLNNSGDVPALKRKCEFLYSLLSRMTPPAPEPSA